VDLRLPAPSGNGGTDYQSRLQLDRASFNPGFVRLYGTKSDLEKIERQTSEKLFELVLRPRDFEGNEVKAALSLRTFKDERNVIIPIRCEPTNPGITVPLTPEYERYMLHQVPVLLDLASTDYTLEDFEQVPRHQVTLDVASNLSVANQLHNRTDEEQIAWADENLRVLAHVEKDFDPTRPISGRLVFLKQPHDNLRFGRDYTYEMLPITLALKRQ
jgi:hypothetical protein